MAKRILAVLLIFLMLLGVAACGEFEQPTGDTTPITDNNGTESATDRTDVTTAKEDKTTKKNDNTPTPTPAKDDSIFTSEEKVIDIYLIAGQSNAVGYTKIADQAAAYAWAPELENGFSNVLFAGKTRWDWGSSYDSQDYQWQKATLALGAYYSIDPRIGPDAGMAKALSEYYNEESGKVAGMIKFGHGGTSLLTIVDSSTTGSNRFGTWVSPSYAKSLGMSDATYQSGKTGALYREFLEVVREKLTALVAEGYTNVNIMGLYWMQGENDRFYPNEYKTAFKCFASDLRSDLSEMLMDLTGADDRGASQMPIFVGTISQTFNLASASAETINWDFITMQKSLPDQVNNCYVVDNSKYRISQYNPSEPGNPIITGLGSDQWHWNQADHLAIGNNVGRAILLHYRYIESEKKGLTAEETGEAMVTDVLNGNDET